MQWEIESKNEGARLDIFLAENMPDVSRARIQRAIASGFAQVNELASKASYRLRVGDSVTIDIPPPNEDEFTITPENIPIEIVYEDDCLIVVNKPKGMVTHPGTGVRHGTLVNALMGYSKSLSTIGGVFRPGILHRLDKDTSGLLIAVKSDEIHAKMAKALEKRYIDRRYLALLWGSPKWDTVRVDAPIGRSPADRKKMAVTDDLEAGRSAITDFTVVERFKGFTLIEAKLHSGRTHQVRVHTAYIHHPVVGDPDYGGERKVPKEQYNAEQRQRLDSLIEALCGQALHAYKLSFRHPKTSVEIQLESFLPPAFRELLDYLRENS